MSKIAELDIYLLNNIYYNNFAQSVHQGRFFSTIIWIEASLAFAYTSVLFTDIVQSAIYVTDAFCKLRKGSWYNTYVKNC